MNEIFSGSAGVSFRRALMSAAWLLVAFLAVLTIQGVKSLQYIGEGVTPTNTINVSGEGIVYAIPDTAEFSFSVVSDKATVALAQADATQKINALTAYLTAAGVAADDIQTTNYSIAPQYSYSSSVCPQAPVNLPNSSGVSSGSAIYCPPGKQVLTGYEVDQTTDVKVRDTTKAGDLLAGVGGKGATEVSGLSFTTEDPTAIQAQARDKAIADAKTKAEVLAKSLGVSLVRIVSFNENGGGNPVPMYAMASGAMTKDSASPAISVGQNKVVSDISITYEIR